VPEEAIKEIQTRMEEEMEKAVEAGKHEFATIRTGRASVALLDPVKVEAYGTTNSLRQVANINIQDARNLIVQPYDKSIMKQIEKGILKSDLGITPNNDGNVIRITIPELTEERRKDLVRLVKKMTEEFRVRIRNIRRKANDDLKNAQKNKDISEDLEKKAHDDVQKTTDKYVEIIDKMLEDKEKEIMEV
jgi:ribosome recycling factor